MNATRTAPAAPRGSLGKPRVGFLGIGWIGLSRLKALAERGAIEIAAVADPRDEGAQAALEVAPRARRAAGLDALLEMDLDGLCIATPSALHAEQAERALRRGLAVFCQKPLGRTAGEAARVVEAARASGRLLGVDMSYRFTDAMRRVRDAVHQGIAGPVHASDLSFHNAYGPDKAWFADRSLSGGGCAMDLGVHLVDLALWVLEWPRVEGVTSRLYREGRRLAPGDPDVEDFAAIGLDLDGGGVVRIACSWWLPAGRDAVIEASFYGRDAGLAMRNVDGSFYDLRAELFRGTSAEALSRPPDAWFGRAAASWGDRLAAGAGYDPSVERLVQVHRVLDRVYG